MTQGTPSPQLRLVEVGYPSASPKTFMLSGEVKIGRSPDCQIKFDSHQYRGVSRLHVTLRPVSTHQVYEQDLQWQICDQGSANGTYVNGQKLTGCRVLNPGDQIILSQNGPQFVFELAQPQSPQPQSLHAPPPIPRLPFEQPNRSPVPQPHAYQPLQSGNPSASPSFSQLIPVVSSGKNFGTFFKKGYLLPGILTVLWVVLSFMFRGNLGLFIFGLGVYLGSIGFSFIYRLCGKSKPWWEILVAIVTTILLLLVPPFLGIYLFIFRGILPGNIDAADNNFLSLFVAHFFGAGLAEELLKALPIFLIMYIGVRIKTSPQKRQSIGVREPLDGIVLGAASGLGFTLVETLVQYVPQEIIRISDTLGGVEGALQGQLQGIQLLVPRIIGSVAGHMAYSGYFGYFIGLSVLFPAKRWQILGIGYLTSSTLHALWNASGGTLGPLFLAIAGITAYVFLIAAILKARELSPTRAQNFATRMVPPPDSR